MWWVWVGVAVALFACYLAWLSARLERLHQRAAAATAALDAALVRRAASVAVLAEQLTPVAPEAAGDLYAVARAALDAGPHEREAAENDLTRTVRKVADRAVSLPGWPQVVTASRRVSLARQVHTDLVRDALAQRRRRLARLFRLARRHPEPAYFDVDDPGLDGLVGTDHLPL